MTHSFFLAEGKDSKLKAIIGEISTRQTEDASSKMPLINAVVYLERIIILTLCIAILAVGPLAFAKPTTPW